MPYGLTRRIGKARVRQDLQGAEGRRRKQEGGRAVGDWPGMQIETNRRNTGEARGPPNKPLQRSCSTCDARTIGNETYWTANRTTSKIIPDRASRDDRRGIGAQESP
jgi:hypothetical protein